MKMQLTSMRRIFTAAFPTVLTAIALTVPLFSSAEIATAQVPLLTGSIDETRLVTLKGSMLPEARAQQSQEVAPDNFKLDRMMLVLKPTSAQQSSLKQLLDDQQNPKSPHYRQWLSPQQFGEQFGAAPEDLAVVTGWLQGHGFMVESTAKGRNLITFSGTQGQLRRTFHTEMRGYTIHGEHHWANSSDVQIPEAIAPVVAGIVSLNDVPRHANHSNPVLLKKNASSSEWTQAGQWGPVSNGSSGGKNPAPQFTAHSGTQPVYLLAPYDFATIYNLHPLWNAGLDGTGQTIAITARSNVNPDDIDAFRTEFGLPAKKLNVVLPTGVDPGTAVTSGNTGDESETDLDVEWSGAVAKGATIDLVATPSSNTTDGTDISDEYIIDENLAPVMSVSYGACEFALQTSGNLFFFELWQQAAAQGITVIVASGDYGPATCDAAFAGNDTFAIEGMTVNGIASTPYDVAVGGTDFKTFNTIPGQFWSPTNDRATLASAQAYVPESPWNDSCENPELLPWLNANGGNYADSAAVCALGPAQYQNFVGGGGGASSCIASTNINDSGSCTGGYPKPSWQSAIPGVPADNVRDLPDVSLFAANGIFNSLIPYCQSDVLATGYTCATWIEGAGGTSFAAPSFAGIMAIVNQKMQSSQGVANYSLYKLGTKQFSDSSLNAACSTSTVTSGNACFFYDVAEGNDRVPCVGSAKVCFPAGGPTNIGGGWDATTGYDLATGIGSINAYNLVNAWPSAAGNLLSTQASITLAAATTYGSPLTATIAVGAAMSGNGTPTGPVVVLVDGQTSSLGAELKNGSAAIDLPAIAVGPHLVTASYGGDAIFYESVSSAVALTVAKASPTVTLTTTRGTVGHGQTITLSAGFQIVTVGNQPTGSVSFTDSTNGAALGTGSVISVTDPVSGVSVTTATLTVAASALGNGANTIVASYSGDANYNAIVSNIVTATYAAPFTETISPASLQISAAAVASGSVTVNVTPGAGATLQASNFTFGCGGTLPPGVSCSFSAPTVNSSGVLSSTLTVQVNTAQIPFSTPSERPSGRLGMIAASGLGGFLFTLLLGSPRKNRMKFLAVLLVGVGICFAMWGCSGSGNKAITPIKSGPVATTTKLTSSSATPPFGSSVTLNASVAPASSGAKPTGSVTFLDGSVALGTVTLANGGASFSGNALSLGSHSMTAKYTGDTGNAPSVSTAASVDVTYSTSLTVTVTSRDGSNSVSLPVAVQ